MSVEEVFSFLDSIKSIEPHTLMRDKAIFEFMYISGARAGEVVNLDISDVDFNKDEVLIRKGKGDKDRFVPLGKVSRKALFEYVKRYRKNAKEKALFIGKRGKKRISVGALEMQFKRYVKLAKIRKKLTPHCMRHTVATHLLEGGADIKYVKEFLGHKSIETTVIYTHYLIDSIKKLFRKYHPRENSLYEELDENTKKQIRQAMNKYQKKEKYW